MPDPVTPPAPAPGTPPPASPPSAPPVGTPPVTPPPASASTPPAASTPPPVAAPVVPETYKFQLPEHSGFTPEALQSFTPMFKDLGLTQDNAQKLVSSFAAQMQTMRDSQTNAWAQQLKTDTEFGGANFDANSAIAQKAVNKFLDNETKAYLDKTGLGNHPGLVKAWMKIGQSISEAASLPPGNAPTPQKTAKSIYNHPTSAHLKD